MAVDAFIWFEEPGVGHPIVGETTDKYYNPKKAFEIKDFSFGVENPTTIGSGTGGAGAGKIKFNEFTIKRTTDKCSPDFFFNSCIGSHYKNVYIEMRKSGGDIASSGKPFLQFRFGVVFTTKIDWSGPGDEGPEEGVTFVYGQFGVRYTPQKPDGTPDDAKYSAWDQIQNIDISDKMSDAYASLSS
jgi:type VI secretion system secreted protein Hcp